MIHNIKTAAGARTRLVFRLHPEQEGVVLHLRTDAGVQSFVPSPADPDSVLLPPLRTGRYLYDFCLKEHSLMHGELQVRPSALWGGCAEVLSVVTIDLPLVCFVLNPGPRGEVGPQGVPGLSAYEVAAQHGFEGSEAEWVAELEGAQSAATQARLQADLSAASAAAASESVQSALDAATAAGNAAESAGHAAELATSQAAAANGSVTTANSLLTLTEKAAENAEASKTAAETAAGQADASARNAEASKSAAETAAGQADASARNAEASKSAAETAAGQADASARNAEASKTAAETTLAGAAQVAANNIFDATNTFNGALVANGSLLYEQQELGDLLTYPIAARLMEAGINPASAGATTWEEWAALNPGWEKLPSIFFYAPLMTGAVPVLTGATAVSSCTYVSPAPTSGSGCQYLLSRNFNLFTLATHGMDAAHCYNGLKAYYCAPRVTRLVMSLNAFALSSAANTAELSVFTPELTSIEQSNVNNAGNTFRRLGTLKTFSIYAPKLVTSFRFADATGSKAQYCSVLQALVAGIGTPETMQTITTLKPLDPENITDLQTTAAVKNWQFVDSNGTPYTYNENDTDSL